VGGDQVAALAALERNLQQVPRVQPQDRPPVRLEVADLGQLLNQQFGLLPARHVDQVVDLARSLAAFVDRGNLDLQHEPHSLGARLWSLFVNGTLQFIPQSKQARFRRHQIALQFSEPLRVCEVAGAQQGHALAPRPDRHVLQIGVAARGPRVLGMHVQVGVEHP